MITQVFYRPKPHTKWREHISGEELRETLNSFLSDPPPATLAGQIFVTQDGNPVSGAALLEVRQFAKEHGFVMGTPISFRMNQESQGLSQEDLEGYIPSHLGMNLSGTSNLYLHYPNDNGPAVITLTPQIETGLSVTPTTKLQWSVRVHTRISKENTPEVFAKIAKEVDALSKVVQTLSDYLRSYGAYAT